MNRRLLNSVLLLPVVLVAGCKDQPFGIHRFVVWKTLAIDNEKCAITSWEVNIKGPYMGILLASNAVRGRFDPIKDNANRIFKIGDVVKLDVGDA